MGWWHRLWRRRQMEEQLEKELRFHLDRHTADLIARGYLPDEARRQARLALGGPEQVKEECRQPRGTRWLEDLCYKTSAMRFVLCGKRRHLRPWHCVLWRSAVEQRPLCLPS